MRTCAKTIFLVLSLLAGVAQATTDTFLASGNWTAPAGVTSVTVEAWGGGGAGGGATGNPAKGGGGAGGQYAVKVITVTPGNTYAIGVGAGGTGSTGNGTAGGNSTFAATVVVAAGGAGGTVATVTNGSAGLGSTAGGVGTTVYAGGNGSAGAGSTGTGGAGGGGAGSNGAGGNASGNTAGTGTSIGGGAGGAGLTSRGAGNTGVVAGGGGGAGYADTGADKSGGNGAAGKVTISYVLAPTATTVAASSIAATGATLNGTVISNDALTTVTFDYGPTTGYGSTATAAQSPLAAGASATAVSAAVTGLTCNTLYHYRVKGESSAGTTNGGDLTFTTSPCAPTATTVAASSIAATGATLNGTVSSNGAITTVTYDYGLTTGYGSTATAAQSPLAAGASATAVSAAVTGLTCNTLYHYRVKGVNSAGTTNGGDLTFTTPACATTDAADPSSITPWVATVKGTISSSTSATVSFEYGLTSAYGDSISATQSPLASGAVNSAVSADLIGLNCNTTFHYRVVATNSSGTTNGLDRTLTTNACTPPFPATACAATRFGTDLNCTANDVNLSSISLAPGSISSCVSGAPVTLDLDLTVNFASPNRWDIGIFIANDGKLPSLLQANGGAASCSVDILPTSSPFLDLDGVPQGTADTCGDGNSTINGGSGSGVKRMSGVTLPCYASPASGGKLFVPYIVSWDNQKSPTGSLCTSNLYPVPNTTSKCNAPAATVALNVVVLPTISKTDGRTTLNPGANTTYTVVINNNTGGTLLDSVFKDPAVADLTVNSVTCAAADGATCPTATVSAMQGSGIAIPSANLPNNSTLTFTVSATLSSNATVGSQLKNIATVTTGGYSTSAEDSDNITLTPSVTKSFTPSSITEDAPSLLTITLTNPTASAVTGVSFTDTYPSGLVNTSSASPATTCGGTVTAANSGSSVALSGGTIPAGGSCTVTVNVTSSVAGSYTNTTGTVTTSSDTISAASSTLTVTAPQFGSFNACDDAADPNNACTSTTTSTTSHITTKVAGTPFTLDLVTLQSDGSWNSSYSGSVIVELLDSSDNSGTLDTNNCRSTWTTVIATLGSNPSFASSNGQISTGTSFTVANAYKDVRVRVRNASGSTKIGCSTDNFAIRPSSLTVTPTDTDWQTTGTARTLNNTDATNPGSTSSTPYPIHKTGQAFTVTVTAKNASNVTTTNYTGTPTSSISVCASGTACSATLGTLSLGTAGVASGVNTWSSATYSASGAFDLTLQDTSFAAVDSADTPATCAGQYICSSATPVGRFVVDTASNSTVVANPTSVAADGSSTSTITVTLNDGSSNPVAGKTVTLAKSGGSSIIATVSGTTDTNGVATFTVKDSTAEGPITYTATNVTDATVITQTAQVTFVPITTLATDTDPTANTIAPGTAATVVDSFTLQTSSGTETITSVTVNLSTNSGVGRLAITDSSGSELGAITSPITGSNTITVSNMTAISTSATTFKVSITPLSHAAMPVPPGGSYNITAPVSAWEGSNAWGISNSHTGIDTNADALTIDNLSPAAATTMSGEVGNTKITLNWTTSASSDFNITNGSVVYRWAVGVAGTEVPAEGSYPVVGDTNGTATVACVVSSAASTALTQIDGTGGSSDCTTTALNNNTTYTYKIFQKDVYGNFDAGTAKLAAPTVVKSFGGSIIPNGTTTLTITITNPNTSDAITGLALTDTYPSSVVNASTPALTNTCGGTTTGTAAGDSLLSLSGATLAANGGSCSISISVTAPTSGSYVNTTSAVTSTNAFTSKSATATLTVSSAFDHLLIEHDGQASNCTAEPVTVKACANAACTTLATAGNITATLSDANITIGTDGKLDLNITPIATLNATSISPAPTNTTVSCWNTATNAFSCSMVISYCSAGFDCLETSLPSSTPRLYTKLAGTDFNFDVVALNASSAIETNYVVSGGTAKNVTVELFNDSSPAGSCSAYAGPVASQILSLSNADAGRKTTAAFNLPTAYAKLRCRVTDTNSTPTVYGCSSDDFSVRPIAPTLSTTASAAAPSATATPRVKAGSAFTIGAATNTIVTDGYTGTLTLDSSKLSAQLPSNDSTAQSGGTVGTLSVSPLVQANASPAQSNNATWDEVGYLYAAPGAFRDDSFTLVDQAGGDCISSTANDANLADTFDANKIGCSIGNKTTVAFGRFVPDHFTVVGTLANTCTAGTFTNMGQTFTMSTANVVEARNTANGVTRNYAGLYAPGTVSFGAENADNGTNLVSRLTFSPGSWTLGVYTLTNANGTFSRPTATVADATWGAFESLDIGLTVNDSDVTTSPKVSGADMDPTAAGGSSFAYKKFSGSPLRMRFGRLSLQNAYGSELLDLPMSLTAEYWDGTGWVRNTDDKCTTGITLSLTDPITDDGLIPSELCAWDTGTPGDSGLGCAAAGTSSYKFNEPPLATDGGNFNLNFQAPGVGNTGALDITATVPDYLKFNWKGTGDINPAARATFGIYKGNSHFIYFREAY